MEGEKKQEYDSLPEEEKTVFALWIDFTLQLQQMMRFKDPICYAS